MASDLIVERLVDFAVRELGEPPSAFAFVTLGSEGRREQTPASDQDNAIVYADAAEPDADKAQRYFVSLGEKVCRWLNEVGVPYCQGGIMAMDPRWCVPLEKWRAYFARWIREPEPQQVLRFNIFFDLRCVTGNSELVGALLATVRDLVAATPSFLLHLAQDLLGRRVPTARKTGEIDLKEATSLIVNFARVYSLRHAIDATNTPERLDGLREARVLSRSSHENVAQAYDLLMRLRLALDPRTPRVAVDPASLPHDQATLLREAMAELPVLQKKMAFDFLGQSL
jgi:CBS domain-containing protein